MGIDHRSELNGNKLDYTCRNRRFWTDTEKGQSHGSYSPTRGSVFNAPLAVSGAHSLWLEHVTDHDENEYYWLMWYDQGMPTIPLSGVFDRSELENMQRLIVLFIP